ncbi:TPA: DegT/DnrJ/EryC1/StrS family aminotransferase [Vibrio cholerae]
MINLNSPLSPDLKKLNRYLEQINRNNWYTNFGPLHEELKENLEEYLEVDNLLLVNNGTTALQVSSLALNSNNILCTPFSFVATASAFVSQRNEVRFSDIDDKSLNLSTTLIEEDELFLADTIVATHVYGNPCEVLDFEVLAKQNNKKIIYDAAHAFGVKVHGKSILDYGDASTLSFHATKVFHTVEGGAIVFKDRSVYEYAKEIINFGINPEKGTNAVIGVNGKMNEYQAAVGLVNLDMMDEILEYRSELFLFYRELLESWVELPEWHNNATLNGAYMPILLNNRNEMLSMSDRLSIENIQNRNYFYPSLERVFSPAQNMKHSQLASNRVLCLPMHSNLTKSEVTKVVNTIKAELARNK